MEKSIAEKVANVTAGLCVSAQHLAGIAESGSKLIADFDQQLADPTSVPNAEEWAAEWKKTIPQFEKLAHEMAIAHSTVVFMLERIKRL